MKKILFVFLSLIFFTFLIPTSKAGDCTNRDMVNWHATVAAATHVRVECDDHKGPVGNSVGVIPAGEVVRILEVDQYREYFIVETSKGTGFIYKSFLRDIVEAPLPGTEAYENSVFSDLNPNHIYYDEIADVKERGIVSGAGGKINADAPINRVELAKILVEATTNDEIISNVQITPGLYSDTEAGSWYLPYLEIARQKNIMTGDKQRGSRPTTVRPGASANGAEVAKMIVVAFDLEIRQAASGEDWFNPYLEALETLGALPYDGANHQVTRGEMMFMISRVLSK